MDSVHLQTLIFGLFKNILEGLCSPSGLFALQLFISVTKTDDYVLENVRAPEILP